MGKSKEGKTATSGDDSSEEEWIFEEASDEDASIPSLARSASTSVVDTASPSAVPLRRFTSKLRSSEDTVSITTSAATPEDSPRRLNRAATSLTAGSRPGPAGKRVKMNAKRASPSSGSRGRSAMDRESLMTLNKKTLKLDRRADSEADDLADQIAAMRIIASKGQDTKYLSIRGAVEPPKIQPADPAALPGAKDPRANIVAEIINTEEAYVSDLEILIRLYLVPLSAEKGKKKKTLLTKDQLRTLFSNVESILNLNRVLLADLQKQGALPPAEQRIGGSSFNLLSKCLLLYADYCSNQKNADDLYTKLKASHDEFNALLAENVQKPECRLLDLNAFLIKPVQRVCKYPLLLRELLKQTPESHADYEDLKAACEAMQESCLKLNERKREVENMSHFLTIKARTGKNFIESGRTFLDDGNVQIITEKVSKRSKKLVVKFRLRKGRYVLFSDMVVFISEGKVVAQLMLSTADVQDPEIPDYPLALMLVGRASRLILLTSSEAQKKSLSAAISAQIDEVNARSKSMEQRRASPAGPRRGSGRQADTAVSYECVMNGDVRTARLPFECQELEDLKLSLKRVYDLPNHSFAIEFETADGKKMPVGNTTEYTQLLPFMKRIVILS